MKIDFNKVHNDIFNTCKGIFINFYTLKNYNISSIYIVSPSTGIIKNIDYGIRAEYLNNKIDFIDKDENTIIIKVNDILYTIKYINNTFNVFNNEKFIFSHKNFKKILIKIKNT